MCELCHEREATAATILSFGEGPNIKLTNLCQPCLDAHLAKAPVTLREMIDQLERESGDTPKP